MREAGPGPYPMCADIFTSKPNIYFMVVRERSRTSNSATGDNATMWRRGRRQQRRRWRRQLMVNATQRHLDIGRSSYTESVHRTQTPEPAASLNEWNAIKRGEKCELKRCENGWMVSWIIAQGLPVPSASVFGVWGSAMNSWPTVDSLRSPCSKWILRFFFRFHLLIWFFALSQLRFDAPARVQTRTKTKLNLCCVRMVNWQECLSWLLGLCTEYQRSTATIHFYSFGARIATARILS